jgi:transcriptional regulator with XRE-family HTH domain
MKVLSTKKLAQTVKKLREQKSLTQGELAIAVRMNRIMIGKVEKETFIPSITQLESLSSYLEFDITQLFVEKSQKNSYVALRSEELSESERIGVEKLFTMMLSLRQQFQLRRAYEHETNCSK